MGRAAQVSVHQASRAAKEGERGRNQKETHGQRYSLKTAQGAGKQSKSAERKCQEDGLDDS